MKAHWNLARVSALALASVLWAGIGQEIGAHAQTTPAYSGSALFDGRRLTSDSRIHIPCTWFQPAGGDYGRSDTDAPAGVARACAQGIVLLDPTTGVPYAAGVAVGGATAAKQDAMQAALDIISAAVVGTGLTTSANHSFTLRMTTATTTNLISPSAGHLTYISAFDVNAGGDGDFSLVSSTVSGCGTSPVTIWKSAYKAGAGIAKGNGTGNLLGAVADGSYVCAVSSAAVTVDWNVTYVQP